MPNLMDDLGSEYVDQFYRRALFQHDNMVCRYDHTTDSGRVSVLAFNKDAQEPEWARRYLSKDDFPDMSKFAWPKLGYRNVTSTSGFTAPYYFATTRSAHRGLRSEYLAASAVEALSLLRFESLGRDTLASAKIAQTIFNPTFTPFLEGMAQLREGDIPGFALSSDVAIAISVSVSADTEFDVLFRGRAIGKVAGDNTVVVPTRFFKRTTINNLFEGRVMR